MFLTGFGYSHPSDCITNEELVSSFNKYVNNYNFLNRKSIERGDLEELKESSASFIFNASGIKKRYVRDKVNLLDPDVMWPQIKEKPDEALSIQAEEGIKAAKIAIANSHINISNIGAVIVASSHKQRDYPTVSIEIQNELGVSGFAFDIGNACSSAIYGIQVAYSLLKTKELKAVLVISPEIKSGQFNPRDRDSHFIFGEATTALVIENENYSKKDNVYRIENIDLYTEFSNNIRNNRGAYNNCDKGNYFSRDKMFYQNGRLVFKDIVKLVSSRITKQLESNKVSPSEIKRFWLHQANIKLNSRIIKNILKCSEYDLLRAPSTLADFGNTSSSGAILCFLKNNIDLPQGALCILSSFGAGYSFGSILLKKIK